MARTEQDFQTTQQRVDALTLMSILSVSQSENTVPQPASEVDVHPEAKSPIPDPRRSHDNVNLMRIIRTDGRR